MDESVLDALGRCPPDAPVYDPPAAAAYLNITPNTLHAYRHGARWRHLDFPKPEQRARWTRAQLDAFNATRRPAGWQTKDTTSP